MTNFLYRVESKELSPNLAIKASGSYSNYLKSNNGEGNNTKNEIESDINNANGNPGIDRPNSLFLFKELKDALVFSAKIYKGQAYIYTCTPKTIIHQGDMNFLDFVNHSIRLGIKDDVNDVYTGICNCYWKRNISFTPCIEYIVDEAIINKEICSKEDCLRFYEEFIANQNSPSFQSVERSSLYLDKLNKLAQL